MKDHEVRKAEIEKAIVRTVAYFDMFDFPLTKMEIWQNLDIQCALAGINCDSIKTVSHKNGFYFLVGREDVVNIRMKRYGFTDKKIKKAKVVSALFGLIPWVKMIAVSNIIGVHNLKEDGDIDLFIVAEKNRVWLVRFISAGMMKLLKMRPRPGDVRDKICLNFFVDLDNLCLEKLAQIKNGHDAYLVYWLAGIVPIYSRGDTYEKFINSNSWIKKYLPNYLSARVNSRRYKEVGGSGNFIFLKSLFSWLNERLKDIQLKLMPHELKELINKDTRVVVEDGIIKMHVNDRREFYNERWRNFLKKYV